MSNFRQPPTGPTSGSESSPEIESSFPAESVRYGSYKPAAGALHDIAPTSTRAERPPGYPQRISSLPPPTSSAFRAPAPAANSTAGQPQRCGKGGIYQAVRLLERKHGAFFISRLILASGINLRGFDASTYDDPVAVSKFIKTLRTMLSPSDMAGLLSQAPSLIHMK